MSKYSIEDVELWAEEYKKHYSFAEVGRVFGISECTVRHNLIIIHKYYFDVQTLDEYQEELAEQKLKKCLGPNGCGEVKSLDEFEFRRDSSDYRKSCKECNSKQDKQYRNKNNKKIKKKNEEYRNNNKEKIRISGRNYEKKKLKTDTEYKIKHNLRTRLRDAIRYKRKVGSAVRDLGCSGKELIVYLEKQFYKHLKTGIKMTWENYGSNWQIDHIVPLATFDLTNRDQFLEACHYTNLQPLWIDDHSVKTAKDIVTIKHKRKGKK